ncbi:sigma-70 family RNA polymerase sigma factor [Aurantibacter crassamenti]|uniref:RNA polymerase sigma factor n=1 Tax=Aurantibacter crassamenti TaxID=1837375 RepID=UPI0019395891|nr:sigma-70 family RNA polymerase sigma factor [Aurantibacter crassamenti]MBM1105446.1 sigma-70 family RNA polymerase sigma factor [Aurantibacter crassamenti]
MPPNSENYKNLRSFFDDEYHSLKAYAKSRIDDTTDRDAGDIIQDVALKLFSRADSLSPIDNIAGFVYNSVRNKVIDLMRKKKNETSLEEDLEKRLSDFTELLYGKIDNSYSEDMQLALKKAIGNLKPLYRNIIIAIDFEGYTYNEIAFETNIPIGTLMSRRHRALSLLLTQLESRESKSNTIKKI